jgi:hypothetical protein
MARINKESTTSVGVNAPLTDYADGITTYYLAPYLGRSYPVRIDGDIVSTLVDGSSFITIDPDEEGDGENNTNVVADPDSPRPTRTAPTLDDIERILPDQIVYDASGNVSVTVTFKVRNSSGEPVKGVNYREQK